MAGNGATTPTGLAPRMSDLADDADDGAGPPRSRRAVLAAGAAGVGALLGVPGPASAQSVDVGLIPTPDRWREENLAGFMIHTGEEVDPDEADVDANCDVPGWPPDETQEYDVSLLNRKVEEMPQLETSLYAGPDLEAQPGDLFLINTFRHCESDHVAVELEQIGREVSEDVHPEAVNQPASPSPDDGGGGGVTPDTGPGFGLVGALAGLAGLGWLLGREEK